jgi:hypothetical protein
MTRSVKLPAYRIDVVLVLILALTIHPLVSAMEGPAEAQKSGGSAFNGAYLASDLRRAIEAYKFFMPTLATEAMMQQADHFRPLNAGVNHHGIKLQHRPHHQILTGNDVTPYAWARLDLKASGPLVIEIPAGSVMGFLVDHNMRWITDLGVIGPDGGAGGKYLILPPDFQGQSPAGFYVEKSQTWEVMPFFRAMSADGIAEQALKLLDEIAIYPLAGERSDRSFKFIDVSDHSLPSPLLQWENNLGYWHELHKVVSRETTPAEYRPFLGMLWQVGVRKDQPFNPGRSTRTLLLKAAQTSLAEMRINAYDNRRPDRAVWHGKHWQWIPVRLLNPDTRDYGTTDFLDIEGLDNIIYQGWGATPAAGFRAAGTGSLYFGAYKDTQGRYFSGENTYHLKISTPVPSNLFWSATVYDADTRSLIATEQNQASINSIRDALKVDEEGNFVLCFSPYKPEDSDANWVQTIPGKDWFIFFRIFGPDDAFFNGNWQLADIEKQ